MNGPEHITEALAAGFGKLLADGMVHSAGFVARVASELRDLAGDLAAALDVAGVPAPGDASEADFGPARERLVGDLSNTCQEIAQGVLQKLDEDVDLALWEFELAEEGGPT